MKIDRFHIPSHNKAEYTANSVACGGQGPYLRSLYHLGKSSPAKESKNPKKVKCDGQTDGGTDGWINQRMDRPTKRGVESRSTRLKTSRFIVHAFSAGGIYCRSGQRPGTASGDTCLRMGGNKKEYSPFEKKKK